MVACVEREDFKLRDSPVVRLPDGREVRLPPHVGVIELEVRGRPREAAGLMEVWRLRCPLPGTLAADLVGYADCPSSGRRAALSTGPGLYELRTEGGRLVEEWTQ